MKSIKSDKTSRILNKVNKISCCVQLTSLCCRMSVMAFDLPVIGTAFALSKFEFKVFTLAIDFLFRIVTFENRFLNLNSHF